LLGLSGRRVAPGRMVGERNDETEARTHHPILNKIGAGGGKNRVSNIPESGGTHYGRDSQSSNRKRSGTIERKKKKRRG